MTTTMTLTIAVLTTMIVASTLTLILTLILTISLTITIKCKPSTLASDLSRLRSILRIPRRRTCHPEVPCPRTSLSFRRFRWGLGFRGSGFRVLALGFTVLGLGFWGLGFWNFRLDKDLKTRMIDV